jgi:hypothetical protein
VNTEHFAQVAAPLSQANTRALAPTRSATNSCLSADNVHRQFIVPANAVNLRIPVNGTEFSGSSAEFEIVRVFAPKIGVATLQLGVILYTPPANFAGSDAFTFVARVPGGAECERMVTLVIEDAAARSRLQPNLVRPIVGLQAAINAARDLTLETSVFVRQTAIITKPTRISGTDGSGPRPILRFLGSAEGKGGLVVKGTTLTLENLELWEAASSDSGNGAGVRLEAAPINKDGTPSNLICRNVAFRFCENGVLGPDLVVNKGRIEFVNCEFDRNGRFQSGREHGIYIGKADELVVDRCHFHDTYTGHELKSRAIKNTVRDSIFGSVNSRCSYEAEFPNGGEVTIERCTFIQSPFTDNDFVLGYGAEWTAANNAPINKLIVRDCIFWNFDRKGYIVRIDPRVSQAQVSFVNCVFINFTESWNVEYRPETIAAMGEGNRVLTIEQAYSEFPKGPRLAAESVAPLVSVEQAIAGNFPPRKWRRVEGTRIDEALPLGAITAMPHLGVAAQVRNVIDAWGGCVRLGDDAMFNGTGHGGGAVNARAAFNSKSMQWRWVTPQSDKSVIAQLATYGADTPMNPTATWHIRPVTPSESKKATATVGTLTGVLHGRYPDGLPAASHGWTNAFALPDRRFGDFYKTRDIRIFDSKTNAWSFVPFPNQYTETYSMHTHTDNSTSRLYAITEYFTLNEFDAATIAKVGSLVLPDYPIHSCVVEREIWYFCRGHGDTLLRFNLDTKAIVSTKLDYSLSHSGHHFADGAGCVYCPSIGAVVRMDAFGVLWSVDVATLTCEKFSVNSIVPAPQNGIWRRFWHDSGRLFAVPKGSEAVWLMQI